MANQLRRLLDDPALARRLGERSRIRIQDFDGRACIRTMEETYTNIMSARRS